MGGGRLAESVGLEQVEQCLAQRRALLNCPRADLVVHADIATQNVEVRLAAWVDRPDFQRLRSMAPAADLAQAGSNWTSGPLTGLPVAVKDVIDVEGMPTRAGSASLRNAEIATSSAKVVHQIASQGAIPIGKASTTEFAYLDPATTTNPFNAANTPGGSSSGSAALVGAGVVPLALGTQTAGSVCRPAAYCGVYAFKPSNGRTSPLGVQPFARSFDTVGVFGITLDITLKAGEAILGSVRQRTSKLAGKRHQTPRVGMLCDDSYKSISAAAQTQLDRVRCALEQRHLICEGIRLGIDFESVREAHRQMMRFEAARAHPKMLKTYGELLGPHWRRALELGEAISDAAYKEAQAQVAAARGSILDAIDELDVVLLPPTHGSAPHGIENTGDAALIVPWTYTAAPMVVMPTALDDNGLPLAVMFAGIPNRDEALIAHCSQIGTLLREQGICIDHA